MTTDKKTEPARRNYVIRYGNNDTCGYAEYYGTLAGAHKLGARMVRECLPPGQYEAYGGKYEVLVYQDDFGYVPADFA